MLLTAELLLHYQRCIRRGFLDIYGDSTQKDPYSNFQIKLMQERLAYQQSILTEQISQGASLHHQPKYYRGDWQTGADSTLVLMRQGVERIYQGVLLVTGEVIRSDKGHLEVHFPNQTIKFSPPSDQIIPKKVTLVSQPDLLIKQPGASEFGDWLYVPYDFYLSKRPKQEYQILAAYHTQLLASVQGAWAEQAWLILRGKGSYEVDLWKTLVQMQSILEECLQMLLSQQEPDVFISRQQCSLCPWLTSCYNIAKSVAHLSLIPGVTPTRYKLLQNLGITTLKSLAEINPVYLEPELDTKIAEQVVLQAKSVFYNQVFLTATDVISNLKQPLTAPVELYFDIEAQPDLNLDYLLGVMVVDQAAQKPEFHCLLAEDVTQEEFIWRQFLNLVESYPNAPIFHFSPYEVDAVKRLGKLYHTPSTRIQAILSRFIDLHILVTSTAILPVESYSLKAIATWLGFKWRDSQANGSQCICWYEDWLQKGDRTLLERIIRYNEDDCYATYRLKVWLVQFLQNQSQFLAKYQ